MKKLIIGLNAAITTSLATSAFAHDFFLLPGQFTAPVAESQVVQASVGSNFPTPENVVTADRVDRLFAAGAGKPQLSVTWPGAKALNLRVTGASRGMVVAAVKTKDRDVEYAEDRITLILEEYRVSPEAAAAVAALAKPRTLKVSSRRFAKTILCIEQCSDRAVTARALGSALEFVAAGSSPDYFRLLSEGRPLANYPVDLVTADGKRRHLDTDAKGEVRLSANDRGAMMLFAAVMTPPAAGERFILDLTTLTFSRS